MLPNAARAERHASRRRSFLQIAAVILAFGVVDGFAVRGVAWTALGIRLGWAGTLVALALWMPPTERGMAVASRGVVWVSVPTLALISYLTNRTDSLLLPVFPALPLIAVLFTDPRVARLTTALCVVSVGGWMWAAHAPVATAVGWIVLELLMGLLAGFGGQHLLRTQVAIVRAQRQRAVAERAKVEALERLATSERRVARSERLALVGSLASGVAHEINNPLAFAKSSARYLQERLGQVGDEETRQAFEDVAVGMERIEQIVRDLRHFSREDREGTSRVDVRGLVEEAVRIASVRFRGTVQVVVEVEEGLPPVETSAGRVVQVLVNLLVNAADALEGARPWREGAQVRVTAKTTDGWLELAVEDNGPGIPPEVLPKLFQPFFTTKPTGKGTGLGLAVSLEYCVRLGGTLVGQNREEGGARFLVRLPLRPAAVSRELVEGVRPAAA